MLADARWPRSPRPVSVGACTSCPARRSIGATKRHFQPPCTRTKVAMARKHTSPAGAARRGALALRREQAEERALRVERLRDPLPGGNLLRLERDLAASLLHARDRGVE